ncbi:hypothetical protein RhiirC2_787248 [Rhizophagus irregularis]|uniref:Uncharacterized protein n=1 Tax=Rhizophagus irregularis TaxID=588596 RepID=A0A2N1MSP6_9GLOM|nr:hypothetical protein RhiirC2_787248 [Rhizophagus irregularis]
MINEVTRVVITKGRENCQALGNLHKSNQNNNAFLTQHASDERSQQKQKGYKAGGEAEKENIHLETNEPMNQDNIEEVVDSLTSEESINVFLARQRLRFVKGNLNKQEMKDSMFLELNIAAHNIDGIATKFLQREIWVWSIYAAPNNQDMRKSLIDELKMAMEGHNRSVHNTIVLHIVLGDFNNTINNKID